MAVTIDIRPRGLELVAVRVGTRLERWGHDSAARRAGRVDPRAMAIALAERDAVLASHDATLNRIR